MRFSSHIKFHCQFLCRFPWKRSFLKISPRKYAQCTEFSLYLLDLGPVMSLTNHHILARSWHGVIHSGPGHHQGKLWRFCCPPRRWELLGANTDFITKTTFLGLKGAVCRVWSIFGDWLLPRKFTPLSNWQDKEILFNINQHFLYIDSEEAWSFLLLKQHRTWTLQVYCVKEILRFRNPRQIWVSDDTSMGQWATLSVSGAD